MRQERWEHETRTKQTGKNGTITTRSSRPSALQSMWLLGRVVWCTSFHSVGCWLRSGSSRRRSEDWLRLKTKTHCLGFRPHSQSPDNLWLLVKDVCTSTSCCCCKAKCGCCTENLLVVSLVASRFVQYWTKEVENVKVKVVILKGNSLYSYFVSHISVSLLLCESLMNVCRRANYRWWQKHAGNHRKHFRCCM